MRTYEAKKWDLAKCVCVECGGICLLPLFFFAFFVSFFGWLFVGAILFRLLILSPFFATFYNPHSLHVCLAPTRDRKLRMCRWCGTGLKSLSRRILLLRLLRGILLLCWLLYIIHLEKFYKSSCIFDLHTRFFIATANTFPGISSRVLVFVFLFVLVCA